MEAGISPVPREARRFQGERAGLVTRSVAGVVDALCVVMAVLVALLAVNGTALVFRPRSFEFRGLSWQAGLTVALTVAVLYLAAGWSITGRTYGDHVMGLRVIRLDGGRVRFLPALLRGVLCVAVPVGLLGCALVQSRRSLQDAVTRTHVVYDWTVGAPPNGPSDPHPPHGG